MNKKIFDIKRKQTEYDDTDKSLLINDNSDLDIKKGIKRRRIVTMITAIAVIAVLMILELAMQMYASRNSSKQAEHIIANQVIDILDRSANEEVMLIEAFKEEHILRAKSIAFALMGNVDKEGNKDKLLKICELMDVDEINIFNQDGEIVDGTVDEYIGMSVNDGEQIGFFKPMLEDKELAMCQDITPNTAMDKEMMYAMVWMENGRYLVQIGIEPTRIMRQIEKNEISSTIKQMPMAAGMEIFVSDSNTGIVLGATNRKAIGQKIKSFGINTTPSQIAANHFTTMKVNDIWSYCTGYSYNNYTIFVVQSVENANEELKTTMLMVFIYLLLAMHICLAVSTKLNRKLEKEQERRIQVRQEAMENLKSQLDIIAAISKDFSDIIMIDFDNDKSCMIKVSGKMMDFEGIENKSWNSYSATWMNYVDKYVVPDEKDSMLRLISKETVISELKEKSDYPVNYHLIYNDSIVNYQIKFVKIHSEVKDTYIAAVRNIEDVLQDKKKFDELEKEAHRDILTGFYNRRAYDEHMIEMSGNPFGDKLVYVAMDVNGLKNINDTLGHDAGDELIKGAAHCMRKALKPYGRIYRVGGDEFVAILRVEKEEFDRIYKAFMSALENWHGRMVESLSVSVGYIARRDYPDLTIKEIEKLADKNMYAAKAMYYSKHGVDRRGQHAAYDVVCKSYSQIFKVNLTTDAFYVIQTDSDEEKLEENKGSVSKWFHDLCSSGQIHIGDVDEFLKRTDLEALKEYFRNGNLACGMQYRRKVDDKFRLVMMDMIPAPEYADDNQIVFLMIKDISNRGNYNAEDGAYSKVLHREKAEQLIHEGIRNEYFFMMYQPQYYIEGKRLRGFEALIRLRLPDGTMIRPDAFIPDAESTNLITKIDEYVIDHAIKEFRPLTQSDHQLKLEINVSAKTMERPDFPDMVKEVLEREQFPAKCLGIEITEYSFSEEMEQTKKNLKILKEMGIGVSLDDFGTGYTSMEKLLELPAMLLKIDKSLIDNIENDSKKCDFVKAVIDMGHLMDCEVLAEGVEVDAQLDKLKAYGCDCVQGYIWGRPQEYKDICEFALVNNV